MSAVNKVLRAFSYHTKRSPRRSDWQGMRSRWVGTDPDALRMAGPTLAVLGGELAAAMSALDRATTLNPNSAQAWRESGCGNCFANRPDAAIAAAQRAMRLSPLDPLGH